MRQVAPHLKPLAAPVLTFAGSAGIGTLKFVLSVALSGFLFIYGPGMVKGMRQMQARVVRSGARILSHWPGSRYARCRKA